MEISALRLLPLFWALAAAQFAIPMTTLTPREARGAVCLDGSPPAYHMIPGWGPGRKKWVVMLMGGAWCRTPESCAQRSLTWLGSTRVPHPPVFFHGIFSNSSAHNPHFYDWNIVYLRYCDGGSFKGNATSAARPDYVLSKSDGVPNSLPLKDLMGSRVNGFPLKGQAVFEALISHLIEGRGLALATHLLLSGISAGGVAALLHCDAFRNRLLAVSAASTEPVVKCLADAAFFIDVGDVFGYRGLRNHFREVVDMHSPTLISGCTQRYGKHAPECLFAEHFLPYISTPVFLVNLLYDRESVNMAIAPIREDKGGQWAACRQDFANCTRKQMAVLDKSAAALVKKLSKAFEEGERRNGAFLLACHTHSVVQKPRFWHSSDSPKIRGQTMAEAVAAWFFGGQHGVLMDPVFYGSRDKCPKG